VRISMIMAMDRAKLIGSKNGLPWHISSDLQHFKQTTMGKPMIMGRKTYESIGRPLPGRPSIVLTADKDWDAAGVQVVNTLTDAFAAASIHHADEMMVIGGASVCAHAMDHTERLYLTVVDHEFTGGDTWLTSFDWQDWTELSSQSHDETDNDGYRFTYYVLERAS